MSLLASDDFNRSDNADLGASWLPVTGATAFSIAGNVAASANSGTSMEVYTGVTWPDGHYSQVRVTSNGTTVGAGPGPMVRASAGALTAYQLMLNNVGPNGTMSLHRWVTGSNVQLATVPRPWATGDTFRLSVIDTLLFVQHNGLLVPGLLLLDGAITGGNAGIADAHVAPVVASLDDWEGGVPDLPYGDADWGKFPKIVLRKLEGAR